MSAKSVRRRKGHAGETRNRVKDNTSKVSLNTDRGAGKVNGAALGVEESDAEETGEDGQTRMKRTFKDSVFLSLFSEERYVYELYRALHPEDRGVDVEDIEIVTLQNAFMTGLHNDLGFIVGDRMLVLVEAQSTWSPNITLRALLYAAQTMKDYAHLHELDLYGAKPVRIPIPELYVVYTGDKPNVPEEITLSGTLFDGAPSGIEVRVRILRDDAPGILGEYVDFARTLDERRRTMGPNARAVRSAIRNCLGRGILTDYLRVHKKEVITIMIELYNQEEIMRTHIASEVRIAVELEKEKLQAEAQEKGLAEGLEEGRAEGRAKGLEEGRAKGLEEGRAEGRVEGRAEGMVLTCRELGLTQEATENRLVASLGMSKDGAASAVKLYW